MRLADLLALEAEAAAKRGYRVIFSKTHEGGGIGSAEELSQDDGTGWKTEDEARAIADRLAAVADGRYDGIHVVGPDGRVVEQVVPWPEGTTLHIKLGEAPVAVVAAPPPEPDPEPEPTWPIVDGLPAAGKVTLLTADDTDALVGDDQGTVYRCPRPALEGREGVKWRPRLCRYETIVLSAAGGRGSEETAEFRELVFGTLHARAAFGAGTWWVRRDG